MTHGFKPMPVIRSNGLELRDAGSNGYAFQIETTYCALNLGLRVSRAPYWFAFVDRRSDNPR